MRSPTEAGRGNPNSRRGSSNWSRTPRRGTLRREGREGALIPGLMAKDLLPRGAHRLGRVAAVPVGVTSGPLFSHPRVALAPLRAEVPPATFSGGLPPLPYKLVLPGVLEGNLASRTPRAVVFPLRASQAPARPWRPNFSLFRPGGCGACAVGAREPGTRAPGGSVTTREGGARLWWFRCF